MKKILIALSLMLILCIIFVSCNKDDNNIAENEAIISAYNAFLDENSDVEANSVVVEVLNDSERLKIKSSGVWYICFHKITGEKYTRSCIDYLYLVSKDNGEVTASIAPENTSNYINYETEISNGIDRGIYALYDYSEFIEQIDECCLIKLDWTEDDKYWNERFSQFCIEDNACSTNEGKISVPKNPNVYMGLQNSKLIINGENAEFLFYMQGRELDARICDPKEVYPIAYKSNSVNYSIVIEFFEPIPTAYKYMIISKVEVDGEWKKCGSLPDENIKRAELKEDKFYLEFSLDDKISNDIFYTIEINFGYSIMYSAQNVHLDFAIKSPNSPDVINDSSTEQEPKEVVCSCPNCQYPITLGDAILIAQNHYFATETPSNLSTHIMTAKDISKITGDSEDRWYILISEECIGKCGDEIHKVFGGGYLYVIDKNTGEIVDKELQE